MAEALTIEARGPLREEGMIAPEPSSVGRWHGKRLRRDKEERDLGMAFRSPPEWWTLQAPSGPYGRPPPPRFPHGSKQVSTEVSAV